MESKKEHQEEDQKVEEEEKKTDSAADLTTKFESLKFNEGSGVPIDPDFLKRVEEVTKPKLELLGDYKIRVNERILIEIVQNDITKETSEAVTNAANSHLMHAGGLALAIARKGGKNIQIESKEYIKEHGPISTGASGVTSAGDMPSKYVIHTVGPMYSEHTPDMASALLQSSILNTLEKARDLKVKSLSIPAISSGIFGFPKQECANIILCNIINWSAQEAALTGNMENVRICNFDLPTCKLFYDIYENMEQENKKPEKEAEQEV